MEQKHFDFLVLDDDASVTRIIQKVLSKKGYTVVVENHPLVARDLLEHVQFSMIICDFKMPDMNGVDFLLYAGKVQPHALRVMLSGQADLNVLKEAVNYVGVYRFLTKPWERNELLQVASDGLAHAQLLKQNKELQALVTKQNQELIVFNKNLESLVLKRTEELQRTIADLEQSDAYKKEFIANASHELRTPMTAILGYLSLFEEGIYGDLGEKQRTAFREMHTNADILLNLINDLLNCSRLDAGHLTLKEDVVSITAVTQEVMHMFKAVCQVKMLDLNFFPPHEDFNIKTDRELFKTIIRNLLSNAIKYTDRGSVSLSIETNPRKGCFSVAVVDTGCGMDPEKIDQLFQRFRTLPNNNLSSSCSTGLGLALVKSLIDKMGGTINARSQIDQGTTIKFDLPLTMVDVSDTPSNPLDDMMIGDNPGENEVNLV